MNEIKITIDQLNKILIILGEFPANKVYDTIVMIHKLVEEQNTQKKDKSDASN